MHKAGSDNFKIENKNEDFNTTIETSAFKDVIATYYLYVLSKTILFAQYSAIENMGSPQI